MNLLKSIEVFQVVCKYKSFSKAANHLNLVPSAVSRQINELEKHLNIRLLNRTTRSISLTTDGRRYLQKMEVITQNVGELVSLTSDEKVIKDHINFTASPALGEHILLEPINEFSLKYPGVSLTLNLVNRDVNLVEEGYDLALRVGGLEDSSMISRQIYSFPFVVVASPNYIKEHGAPLHPKDLSQHNCIINTIMRTPYRWKFVEGKNKIQIKVKGSIEANNDAMQQGFSTAGLGISYIPLFIVKEQIASGKLVPILTEYTPEPVPISIVYPSRKHLSNAKRKFIDTLAEYFLDKNPQK
ncbi:LysR substrate-binding domain-containing protein [Pseudocolwellia sp. AS88]|uniref:LysR family transcriptional regulator n=1 Tax=Pseudocolwellia sp. AS88 TaxID=3063958 RepID=UPI0026EA2160|nr:LysR family transcriptional regulator [Pseudocolwellia sp. AS88]MDO7086518.1 LysR substrate-binding domain-containing protein [Pseudocolwellia sp. AS88]